MRGFALIFALLLLAWPAAAQEDGYDQDTILKAAENFFGQTSEGLAKVVQKVFEEKGKPNAYIAGEEGSGAVGIGLRYGRGTLRPKSGAPRAIYWQGPTIGIDFGGNASKTFVLVYNLRNPDQLYQRFPGVEGSYYFVGGVGVNYQQTGDIVLAPIRTGVGLRAGVNIGYLHYTRTFSWIPF